MRKRIILATLVLVLIGIVWAQQPVSVSNIPHVIADSGSTTAVTGNVASTVADGANTTLGSKADAKSTATDTTPITIMQVLKQISASAQAPPSQAVTNTGTFAVQPDTSGSTGSAVPAKAAYAGGNVAGNLTGAQWCQSTATYDASTSGSTELVSLTSTQVIYVCGYEIMVGSTATNVKLIYGTGTACATGSTNLTPAWQIGANGGKVSPYPANSYLFKTAASNALCVNTSAANAVQVQVYYQKF